MHELIDIIFHENRAEYFNAQFFDSHYGINIDMLSRYYTIMNVYIFRGRYIIMFRTDHRWNGRKNNDDEVKLFMMAKYIRAL